ncbi:hypothetical protein RZS08_39275, partial [Arthrospira platensis SPKY1]|nr:hypothetical protein [Arthrospira platensis SPKY1]
TSSTGSNVTLPEATTSNAGLMSSGDKNKLNGLSNVNLTGGTNVTITGTYPNLTISSTDTNTTYSAGNGIGLSGTTFSVAGGDGLTQQASGLAVDSTVLRTTGNQTVTGPLTLQFNGTTAPLRLPNMGTTTPTDLRSGDIWVRSD